MDQRNNEQVLVALAGYLGAISKREQIAALYDAKIRSGSGDPFETIRTVSEMTSALDPVDLRIETHLRVLKAWHAGESPLLAKLAD